MIILRYCEEGYAYSDFEADHFVNHYIEENSINENNVLEYKVSTENIILGMRVAVYEGRIPCNQVELVFNGEKYYLDKHGRAEGYPGTYFDDMLDRLLGL